VRAYERRSAAAQEEAKNGQQGREAQRRRGPDEQALGISPCLVVASAYTTGSCRPCCVVGLSFATTGRERREGVRW
jgi:hypothetical protein